MRLFPSKPPLLALACALACVLAAPPGARAGHGEEKPAEKKEEKKEAGGHGGHGEAAAAAEPEYKLGEPLDGYFDRTTLRSGQRVVKLRRQFQVAQTVNVGKVAWLVKLGCVLEFGSETGVAEVEHDQNAVLNEIRSAVLNTANPGALLTVPGKLRLKEEIAGGLNRRLATARVRQVYFTEFLIGRSQ